MSAPNELEGNFEDDHFEALEYHPSEISSQNDGAFKDKSRGGRPGPKIPRPSVDLDFSAVYMSEGGQGGDFGSSTFYYNNPTPPEEERTSVVQMPAEGVSPSKAEAKEGSLSGNTIDPKQSKQEAKKGLPFFRLPIFFGRGKKDEKKQVEDTVVTPPVKERANVSVLVPPSLPKSKTRSFSSDHKSKTSKEQKLSQNDPLLKYVKEKILIPRESKPPVVVTSQNGLFAKSVLLSLDAVTASRDLYKNDPGNVTFGLSLCEKLEALADIYKSFGDYYYGATLLAESVSLRKGNTFGSQKDIAVALNDLGLINLELKRYSEAYGQFEEAFYLLEEYHDGPTPDSAVCLGHAGVALRGAARYKGAITAHDKAVSQMKAMVGSTHHFCLQQKAMLAMSLCPAGDEVLGKRMLKEVIDEISATKLEECHPYLEFLRYEYDQIVKSSAE